jgi:hypothetical protein
MCFTGNVILALMIEAVVQAPVMCQPGLPFHQFPLMGGSSQGARRAALGISASDLQKARAKSASVPLLGYRFQTDTKCPAERFATLRSELGCGFRGKEIPTGPTNPGNFPGDAHSVLTKYFADDTTNPTRQALDEILAYLRARL